MEDFSQDTSLSVVTKSFILRHLPIFQWSFWTLFPFTSLLWSPGPMRGPLTCAFSSIPLPWLCIHCSLTLLPLQNSDSPFLDVCLLVSIPCSGDKFLEGKCHAHNRQTINRSQMSGECVLHVPPLPPLPRPLPDCARKLVLFSLGSAWLHVDQGWRHTACGSKFLASELPLFLCNRSSFNGVFRRRLPLL